MNEHAAIGQFEHEDRFVTEAYERKGESPDTWATERHGSDGEIYLAVFHGPDSRALAEEYAAFKNAQ